MSEETQEAETSTPDETQPQQQVIGITVTAAKLICEIITICTKRGAFNPDEISVVGTLFNQLVAQIPAEEAPEASTDGASDEVEVEVTPAEEAQLELELEEATK